MAKMTKAEIKKRRDANFKKNKRLKFDTETIFMILMVDDKASVEKTGKDGGTYTSLQGYYLLYNPVDDKVSFFQKWMLKHNKAKDERERYSLVHYDEIKTEYDPMYQEWQVPNDSEDYPSAETTFEAEYDTVGFYDGKKVKSKGKKTSSKEEEETESEAKTSEEYEAILHSEGMNDNEIDLAVSEEIDKMKGLIQRDTALFIICKEMGVENKEVGDEDDEDLDTSKYSNKLMYKFMEVLAKYFLEFGETLKLIDSKLQGVLEYLCTITADETVGLKDLLSSGQLAKRGEITEEDVEDEEEEEEPEPKPSPRKRAKKSSKKKK